MERGQKGTGWIQWCEGDRFQGGWVTDTRTAVGSPYLSVHLQQQLPSCPGVSWVPPTTDWLGGQTERGCDPLREALPLQTSPHPGVCRTSQFTEGWKAVSF